MKNIKLHWQILIAMVLGIIFALIFKEQTVYVQPLGDIFMRLLKMVIVPLIFSSITFGVAGLDTKSLGRLGLKTFGYYALTSFIAISSDYRWQISSSLEWAFSYLTQQKHSMYQN